MGDREDNDWRTEPVRPPYHSMSDSELARHADERAPTRGEIHFFETRAALRRHFNSIPEEQRGELLNQQETRGSSRLQDRHGSRANIFTAIGQFIGGLFTRPEPPPYTIVLCEQEPLLQTICAGAAISRRTTQLSPPSGPPTIVHQRHGSALPAPTEHLQSRGNFRRLTGANLAGMGLDIGSSINISLSERAHHVVVIQQPPPGQGLTGYTVWIRPQVSATRRGEWQMMPVADALQYLGI